ncbi:transferase hexapeptide domain protein [Aspergillus alliaceus]|uniref:transferase hexapeptide domain protein n=1 Tax=Petromyces alliaceus TaxID=209559 RepID=UPI0012A3E91F|nr:trimeric LpxA-like protein [Aspergillus alliaceus]KAB8229780.1 trimeric LpxA-like protein [Aspergillus alliaceus]
MDHRQSQVHLKPPPPQQIRTSGAALPSASPIPRAPVTAHPTATVADTVIFHGTHPIAIGAGTIVHPRAKLYSYEGPIVIGENCIISEKSTIGAVPTQPPSSLSRESRAAEGLPVRISSSVIVGPLATVLPGAHIHSAVTIETLVTINRRVDIGAHSKICSGCEVSDNVVIRDWTVVWGFGAGFGQRRRKRATEKMSSATAVAQGIQALEGRVIEDARLMVLQKEREALVRLIGSAGGRRR